MQAVVNRLKDVITSINHHPGLTAIYLRHGYSTCNYAYYINEWKSVYRHYPEGDRLVCRHITEDEIIDMIATSIYDYLRTGLRHKLIAHLCNWSGYHQLQLDIAQIIGLDHQDPNWG